MFKLGGMEWVIILVIVIFRGARTQYQIFSRGAER